MSPAERTAVARLGLQRRTVANRVKKSLMLHLGHWEEDYDGSQGNDNLVNVCNCPSNPWLGLYMEEITAPTFSSLLKRVGYRKRIADLEDGLERAHETYGASRQFIGLVLDIGGNYFVFTGNPALENSQVDFLRMSLEGSNRRYLCSLEGLLSGLVDGDLIL